MKKTAFLLVCLFAISSFAQAEGQASEYKNVVGFSPFAVLHGLRFKYERVLTPKFTAGSLVTGYYGSFPGVQIAPVGRFYFNSNAPQGLYGQAKIVAGFHNYWGLLTSFGGGAAVGYQTFLFKERWAIDVNLGFKLVSKHVSSSGDELVDAVGGLAWYLWGPGSIIDGLVSISYRF